MKKWQKCPVCGNMIAEQTFGLTSENKYGFDCKKCGKYELVWEKTDITNISQIIDKTLNDYDRVNLSGWILDNQGQSSPVVTRKIVESFRDSPQLSVAAKAEKLMIFLSSKYPAAGKIIDFDNETMSDLFSTIDEYQLNYSEMKSALVAICCSRFVTREEANFVWKKFLIEEKRYLTDDVVTITPAGWEYIEQLRARNPKSKKAFVAMWFDDNLKSVYEEYISEAVKSCGFKAERVDYVEHNDLIIDKILSNINSSRFVIADFTGNRAGVYYEAGYARGLNIPVIYTCNNSWFNANYSTTITVPIDSSSQSVEVEASFGTQIHFDLLQQNFLLWENGEDLKEKLINRINATINRPDQI